MFNFYDFEVFKEDWLVVIINPQLQQKTVIVNDPEKLREYYEAHKAEIWIGYNSRNYDTYILKAILLNMNPKDVNDYIITQGNKGWMYSSLFQQIQLYDYDCMPKFYGLKQLEGFMGNDMRDSTVPFDIDRSLTQEEIAETIEYCTHDVEQTMQVFLRTKETYNAHIAMLKAFDLPIHNISKTQAQLSALALGCQKKEHYDEWEYSFVPTLRIEKYKEVKKWFELQREAKNYDARLMLDVCGVPHIFGWGGLHGAPEEPLHRKGLLIHVDVASFYPSIMIEYDMLSRNVKDKSVYKRIYDTRIALKKAGKKKEQAPYKIILNSTYGICKDKYNPAYDPRRANEICVNGQLLLLDLLEHLEGHCEIIQSNTDGLIIQIEDTDEAFNLIDDICYEWEQRTKMNLGFDVISEIFQKDVNNYLFIGEDGSIERKGAYVKELNDLDNDLPVVNEAIVKYMIDGTPPTFTVRDCNDLKQFQKVVKVSSKYECAWHKYQYLQGKTFRVFASKDQMDTHIGKVKTKNGKKVVEKFANTPEYCFIENGDVNGHTVPDKLDKSWYIRLAENRLQQFGVK